MHLLTQGLGAEVDQGGLAAESEEKQTCFKTDLFYTYIEFCDVDTSKSS